MAFQVGDGPEPVLALELAQVVDPALKLLAAPGERSHGSLVTLLSGSFQALGAIPALADDLDRLIPRELSVFALPLVAPPP